MEKQIEFLYRIEKEISNASYGEGIEFNLREVSSMIRKRIIDLSNLDDNGNRINTNIPYTTGTNDHGVTFHAP